MISVYTTPDELGNSLAADILRAIEAARQSGRAFLLGCPGGRSLKSTYQALGRQAGAQNADLSHLVIVMMDEYLQPGANGFYYCPIDAHFSCRRFAETEIRQELNQRLAPRFRIPETSIWLPDPADPGAFDERLATAGGIDWFLLACGASDGHVAFNPPGSPLDSPARIIELAERTRRDNMATFTQFRDISEVPTHGVSVGLGTIAEQSKRAAMVIHGAHKQNAVRRLLAQSHFDPDWPATVIYACRNARILLDEAAAGRESDPDR